MCGVFLQSRTLEQTVNLPSALFIYSYFVVIFCQTTDNNTKIMNKEKEKRKNDGNSGEEA